MDSKLDHRIDLWQQPRDYLVNRIIAMETIIENQEAQLAVDRKGINHNFNKKEAKNAILPEN